jgi:protein-serine/threonine kinase
MLADFDLSKPTAIPGRPTLVKNSFSRHSGYFRTNVDTKSCTASLRTNSFVGTEEYICPEVIKGCGHTSAVDWWTLGILIYEMIVMPSPFVYDAENSLQVQFGVTPFKGASRNDTFTSVLHKDVQFPDYVPISSAGRSIIRKLLHKDEARRLGSRNGASDIKAHPFFQAVSWALLRHSTPPIIPVVNGPGDTSNFRVMRDSTESEAGGKQKSEDGDDNVPLDVLKASSKDPFAGFESVSIHHGDH